MREEEANKDWMKINESDVKYAPKYSIDFFWHDRSLFQKFLPIESKMLMQTQTKSPNNKYISLWYSNLA